LNFKFKFFEVFQDDFSLSISSPRYSENVRIPYQRLISPAFLLEEIIGPSTFPRTTPRTRLIHSFAICR